LAGCGILSRSARSSARPDAPSSPLYSQGVEAGSYVHVSGYEYATWFPAAPPTRYVTKLGVEIPGVLLSIRMTAFLG
jgi:hypothetical protein